MVYTEVNMLQVSDRLLDISHLALIPMVDSVQTAHLCFVEWTVFGDQGPDPVSLSKGWLAGTMLHYDNILIQCRHRCITSLWDR